MKSSVFTHYSLPITHYPLVGIDEAGRGPLAGPVTVSAVAFLKPFDHTVLSEANDSKKLSPKKREKVRNVIEQLSEEGFISFSIQSTDALFIDTHGIVPAIRDALSRALSQLSLKPEEAHIQLDGSLKAPPEYIHQETIIRGDATHLAIMLASIMAKTERDREMIIHGARYPEYGFEVHKGYGTKRHYEAIKKNGLCALHRTTFIT